VVVLAQEEARELRHGYIGTEHILLGLLREEEGLAARVLEALDITVDGVRVQVVRIVGSGEEVTSGQIPFTARAKKVLELALTEALSVGHNYIGTEHVLLGLVRESDGVAVRILLALGADAEKIRNEMIRMLSGAGAQASAEVKPAGVRQTRHLMDQAWFEGLGAILNRLAVEIRYKLKREPDTGDLLLALACTPDTLAAQALHELGVDHDELQAVIERLHAEAMAAREQLAQRIEEVRQAKELAIESQKFQTAAQLRDQERELTEQARAHAVVPPEVLQQISRRLGLPSPGDASGPPSDA
jgi:ATP-dependent Clp protease ATP-binding subunit ClpA